MQISALLISHAKIGGVFKIIHCGVIIGNIQSITLFSLEDSGII